MSSFRQSAMLIEINGIEMDVQYRYAPKKYYDYFSPPDPVWSVEYFPINGIR